MITNKFNSTQQELYMACRLGWAACRTHLAEFSAFKAFYTTAYLDLQEAEIISAEIIPNNVTRRDDTTTQKEELTALMEKCLSLFRRLKRYNASAFSDDVEKSKNDAAGQSYFANARSGTWNTITNLNITATQFIENNLAALLADQNMPPAFPTLYTETAKNYAEKLLQYLTSINESKNLTYDNITASNDIYEKLMQMLKDAQEVFEGNDKLKTAFTFSDLVSRVSSVGVAGLRGSVKVADTQLPIVNATVMVEGKNKSVVTDAAGRYEIPQLANGLYTVIISAKGFNEVVMENVEVKTSTYNTLNVAMQPKAMLEPVLNGH